MTYDPISLNDFVTQAEAKGLPNCSVIGSRASARRIERRVYMPAGLDGPGLQTHIRAQLSTRHCLLVETYRVEGSNPGVARVVAYMTIEPRW